MPREELLTQTFVQLADTLVDQFDIIELLTTLSDRCVEIVNADAVGILLADRSGKLQVMASSNEHARLLELFQLQNDEGPCLDAFSGGEPVCELDLRGSDRWPAFAQEAVEHGFGSVYALPLRLRTMTIGALNLFRASTEPMADADVALAQALADVAAIAILQDQAVRESQIRAGELQHALDSRVAIEQAKGMIAERAHVDVGDAFERLRSYARSHNRLLTEVAFEVVRRTLPVDDVTRQR